MRIHFSLFLISLFTLYSCTDSKTSDSGNSESNETIFFGGDIITMEGNKAVYAEAVVTKNGEIAFVGDLKSAKNKFPNHKTCDLKNKTMVPGFIEPHFHPGLGTVLLPMHWLTPEDWDLGNIKQVKAVNNRQEFIAKLEELVSQHKPEDGIIEIFGYSQFFHGNIYKPTLDSIAKEIPLMVFHRSFHETIFNSAGLEYFGYTKENMNDHQANFEKGYVMEEFQVLDFFYKRWLPTITSERWRYGMDKNVQIIVENGITSSHDPGGSLGITSEQIEETYKAFDGQSTRYYYTIEPRVSFAQGGVDSTMALIKTKVENNTSNVITNSNQIKLFIDGGMFSQAMMLSTPYTDGHDGEYITTPENLYTIWKPFWERKLSAHIHVNGDAAVDDLFKIIERLKSELPWADHRTVFEHFGVSRPEQAKKMKELGVAASVNAYYPVALSENFAKTGAGPEERAHYFSRNGSLLRNQVRTSIHSDFPMAPPSPLFLMWCSVNRISLNGNIVGPEERITAYDALRAITIDAAYCIKQEDKIGSITVGKKADFTIIDSNPLKIDPLKIKDIKVISVVFEGISHRQIN